MPDVENRCGEIKATLRKLTDVKCSSTGRLVAVLMACGIESTTEIAQLIGKSDRMVRIARKEISAAGNLLPETDCRRKQASGNQLPNAETDFRPSPTHACAQMESPSEIVGTKEASKPRGEVAEIDGLNGATVDYSIWLAGLLAGNHGYRDVSAARDILNGFVRAYGADKVHAGVLELQVRMRRGERFADLGKAFSSYVKNAKPASDQAPKPTKAEERKAGAMALRDSIRARAAAEAVA